MRWTVDAAIERQQGRRENHGESRCGEGVCGAAQERHHGHPGDGLERRGVHEVLDVRSGRTHCGVECGGDSEEAGAGVICIIVDLEGC